VPDYPVFGTRLEPRTGSHECEALLTVDHCFLLVLGETSTGVRLSIQIYLKFRPAAQRADTNNGKLNDFKEALDNNSNGDIKS
jgi:hypothetical protein